MIGLLSFIVIIFIAVFWLWTSLRFYVDEKHVKRILQMYDDDLKRLRKQGIIK